LISALHSEIGKIEQTMHLGNFESIARNTILPPLVAFSFRDKRIPFNSMRLPFIFPLLPKPLWLLLALYFAASFTHFTHNAEFIAFYPNMPAWITRETVYLAWLAVSSVGVAGLLVLRAGWHALGVLFIAAYGAFGFDGLLHYTLALCAEHTLATNLTIWFEVIAGAMLMLAALGMLRAGGAATMKQGD
jgi:hypothetical protein